MAVKTISDMLELMWDRLGGLSYLLGSESVAVIKKSIQNNVYNKYVPKEYPRQLDRGGFLGSWDFEKVNDKKYSTHINIHSFPDDMLLDRENFIHGSSFSQSRNSARTRTNRGPRSGNWSKARNAYGSVKKYNNNYQSDIRASLAEIIQEGKSGGLFGFGKWRLPRDFWNPAKTKILNSVFVDAIVGKELKRLGIKFIKIK